MTESSERGTLRRKYKLWMTDRETATHTDSLAVSYMTRNTQWAQVLIQHAPTLNQQLR